MENFVTPLLNLGFALALSLLVGLEREYHAKSAGVRTYTCLLYTSPSPRDRTRSRMPSSA